MDNDHAIALIARSRRGDARAFEELVAGHQEYAFALSFRFLDNPEDAREIVQEVFLKIWTRLEAFDAARPFKIWLSRIAVNSCLDLIRSLKRRPALPLTDGVLAHCADSKPEDNPERGHEGRELLAMAMEIANRLPPRQRSIFILRDLEDLEMGEIADILDVSQGAVKSNLCHARRAVRRGLLEMEKKERNRP